MASNVPTHDQTNGNGLHGSDASPDGSRIDLTASGSSSPGLDSSSVLRLASVLLQRQRFGQLSGLDQFGGKRRLYEVLGYPTNITFSDYEDRFRRGGIARRIVKALPSMMGWGKFQVVERPIDEGGKGSKTATMFERQFAELNKRLSLGTVFKRADILAGKGEYSVIYIGVREVGGNLQEPMSNLKGPDDIAYLRPLDQSSAEIVEWIDKEQDIPDPRYGMPKLYSIKLNGNRTRTITRGSVPSGNEKRVHWSRVIHITHEPLDNELFSSPVLEAVWNDLIDIDKLGGGGSEAFYREAVRRVLFDLDQDIGPDQIDQATKDKLKDDLESMMHNLSQYAFTRGVTPKAVDNNLSSIRFAENIKCKVSLVAATLDLPQRRLLGSESAYASADNDKNTEEESIATRQEEFGTPVVRQFVDRMIEFKGFVKPSQYEVVWPTEDKKKIGNKIKVIRDIALANRDQMAASGEVMVTTDEARDMILDMEPLPPKETEEEVEEKETEEEEIEEEPIAEVETTE